MVKKTLKISWDTKARDDFHDAILFIREQAPQNAEIVKEKVLLVVEKLSSNPEKHPRDKYRENNDGRFHAFELYRFRISYYISQTEIRIVRFRNTSMKPLKY